LFQYSILPHHHDAPAENCKTIVNPTETNPVRSYNKKAASVSEGRLRCFNFSPMKRLAGGQVEFAADAGVGVHGVGPFGVGGKLDGEPPVGDG